MDKDNSKPVWTFNEKQTMGRVIEYISDTYSAHYAKGRIQATEFIADQGLAMVFSWLDINMGVSGRKNLE